MFARLGGKQLKTERKGRSIVGAIRAESPETLSGKDECVKVRPFRARYSG